MYSTVHSTVQSPFTKYSRTPFEQVKVVCWNPTLHPHTVSVNCPTLRLGSVQCSCLKSQPSRPLPSPSLSPSHLIPANPSISLIHIHSLQSLSTSPSSFTLSLILSSYLLGHIYSTRRIGKVRSHFVPILISFYLFHSILQFLYCTHLFQTASPFQPSSSSKLFYLYIFPLFSHIILVGRIPR